jgi:hypothetical protein
MVVVATYPQARASSGKYGYVSNAHMYNILRRVLFYDGIRHTLHGAEPGRGGSMPNVGLEGVWPRSQRSES